MFTHVARRKVTFIVLLILILILILLIVFETNNSHKHNSIITISTKNIRKHIYRRAITALYNNNVHANINTINNRKADGNAYILLMQQSFDKLHDYWVDDGYRNYLHYETYCNNRLLKFGIRYLTLTHFSNYTYRYLYSDNGYPLLRFVPDRNHWHLKFDLW